MAEATDDQLREFGAALAIQLMGRPLSWLAAEVGRVTGTSVTKQSAADWQSGVTEPLRVRVFAMEQVFELAPGSLSRLLGYLPVEAVPAATIEEAIRSDAGLSRRTRDALLGYYRGVVEG